MRNRSRLVEALASVRPFLRTCPACGAREVRYDFPDFLARCAKCGASCEISKAQPREPAP